MGKGSAIPVCAICCETLGKYGGPVTLPCGHNGCLQCMAHVQQTKPECPLCRASFDCTRQLVVNHELRDLVTLACALNTVEEDGWQTVTATKQGFQQDLAEEQDSVTLVPSAPPLRVSLDTVLEGQADLLSLEPPTWVPDSQAMGCGICHQPFWFIRRTRHHCRLCGHIFCHACCNKRLLLPPKFQESAPQRVCESCVNILTPLQPLLAGTISKAVQPVVHDVTDYSVLRSWLNSPLTANLETDIYKATNIIRAFASLGTVQPEAKIPSTVLKGAAGFAILSVVKVGIGWSGALGTGLVVARQEDGQWSPPSAIACASVGWGLQVGGELTDLLIVLRTPAALQAFCGAAHLGVGGNVGLAVGPLGRQADANMHLAPSGSALCYSYSCSRGMFAGISIEGSIMRTRDSVNLDFYGRPYTARQLLLGRVISPPSAASALYDALDALLDKVGEPMAVPAIEYCSNDADGELSPEHSPRFQSYSHDSYGDLPPVPHHALEGPLGGGLPLGPREHPLTSGGGVAVGGSLYPEIHAPDEEGMWMGDLFD